jgi:hypothetical protein
MMNAAVVVRSRLVIALGVGWIARLGAALAGRVEIKSSKL